MKTSQINKLQLEREDIVKSFISERENPKDKSLRIVLENLDITLEKVSSLGTETENITEISTLDIEYLEDLNAIRVLVAYPSDREETVSSACFIISAITAEKVNNGETVTLRFSAPEEESKISAVTMTIKKA